MSVRSAHVRLDLFALPRIVLLIALMILPALFVLPIALTNWEFGRGTLELVGFANFTELAGDPRFLKALGNTIAYALVVVPATVVIGLFVALLIQGSGRFM